MSGLGILAALGGAGRGYMAGQQFISDQAAQAAKTKLLQQQAQDAQNTLDMQADIAARTKQGSGNDSSSSDPNSIQAQKASVLNSESQDASGLADVAAAPGSGPVDPIAAGLVKDANSPAPAQPTVAGIATDLTRGKPVVSPEPATVASPVANTPSAAGIAVPTQGSPVNLAASPGIRALPANVPTAADTPRTPPDAITSQNNAFAKMAPDLAQIAMQHGRPDVAQVYMKMAGDAEMNTYTRAWQNTMRTLASGNDQAAATAISNLYNLGFPDSKHIDIQPLGQGQFKVVQYDTATGKMIDGAVVDRNTMMQYGETFLNPTERVKLQMEREQTDKALKISQNQLTGVERRAQATENAATTRADTSNANVLAAIAAGKYDRKGGADPQQKQDNLDAKRTDAWAKQANLAITSDKSLPADSRSEIAANAEKYVRDPAYNMDPVAAANQATKDFKNKTTAASAAVNEHMAPLTNNQHVWNSDDSYYRANGDPAAVKAAAAMATDGKVTAGNYKKAVQKIVDNGGTVGAPAAAPAVPSRASTSTQPDRVKFNTIVNP